MIHPKAKINQVQRPTEAKPGTGVIISNYHVTLKNLYCIFLNSSHYSFDLSHVLVLTAASIILTVSISNSEFNLTMGSLHLVKAFFLIFLFYFFFHVKNCFNFLFHFNFYNLLLAEILFKQFNPAATERLDTSYLTYPLGKTCIRICQLRMSHSRVGLKVAIKIRFFREMTIVYLYCE